MNKGDKNQGPRLAALAAIGAVLATQVVAPTVVAGLGFTSQGIASGSVATTMMATEAAAGGGGVAAGGMVAVLQSAGALGLRIGAVSGIAIVGALIGVAVALLLMNQTMTSSRECSKIEKQLKSLLLNKKVTSYNGRVPTVWFHN